MAYEDYLKQKADRDNRLWKYHLAFPSLNQRSLAKIFKISQARVSKILRKKADSSGSSKVWGALEDALKR